MHSLSSFSCLIVEITLDFSLLLFREILPSSEWGGSGALMAFCIKKLNEQTINDIKWLVVLRKFQYKNIHTIAKSNEHRENENTSWLCTYPFHNPFKESTKERKKIDPHVWIFDDLKTAILKQNLMLSVLLYFSLFLYKLEWPLGWFLKEVFNPHGIDKKSCFKNM